MTTHSPSARRATPATLTLWVIVCAAVPVMDLWIAIAAERNFTQSNADYALLSMPLALFLPALLQWMVLWRVAPTLPAFFWIAFYLFSEVAGVVVLEVLHLAPHAREIAFAKAYYRSSAWELTLQWAALLFCGGLAAVVYYAVPLWLLGRIAKRDPKIFLAFIILAGCLAELAIGFTYVSGWRYDIVVASGTVMYSQAQWPWPDLAQIAVWAAMLGALRGIVSGYGLMRMFAASDDASALQINAVEK